MIISSGSSQSHQIYDITIWSLGHTHATVKFVLLPEIIASHLMQEKDLNYKEALILMYGNVPPTEHHLKLLINVFQLPRHLYAHDQKKSGIYIYINIHISIYIYIYIYMSIYMLTQTNKKCSK